MDLRIFPLSITSVCETYSCNNFTKYAVARYDVDLSIQLSTGHRFCEECARNLAGNIPFDLSGVAADIQDRIRKDERDKVTAEFKTEIKVLKLQSVVLEKTVMKLQAAAEVIKVEEKPPEVVEDEPEENLVFRCLDCNIDFKNKTELKLHRAEHKKEQLTKGNG